MTIIHDDIVEIWNLKDKTRVCFPHWSVVLAADGNQFLSSDRFKKKMSHLVKDLAVSAKGTPR